MPRVRPRTIQRSRRKAGKAVARGKKKSDLDIFLDSPLVGFPSQQRKAEKFQSQGNPIHVDPQKMQQRKRANKFKVIKT